MFGGLHRHFTKHFGHVWSGEEQGERREEDHGAHIQMARSCTTWSGGKPTEHSIANAYIDAITNAQKFVYIENQVRFSLNRSLSWNPALSQNSSSSQPQTTSSTQSTTRLAVPLSSVSCARTRMARSSA